MPTSVENFQVSECKICKAHKEGYLSEYSNWIVRESEKEKKIPGYFYLEARNHIESYAELSESAWIEFGKILSEYSQLIISNHKPKKLYTVSIAEAVPHLHFHLVPRYVDEPRGMDYLQLALTGKIP